MEYFIELIKIGNTRKHTDLLLSWIVFNCLSVSDKTSICYKRLLNATDSIYLINLDVYPVTYSTLCKRIGLSTINIPCFYESCTSCNRVLLNCKQCAKNLLAITFLCIRAAGKYCSMLTRRFEDRKTALGLKLHVTSRWWCWLSNK